MSILLVTGVPGAGKTLFALLEVDKLAREAEQAGKARPVYAANVRGLKREWAPCDPHEWMSLPDGAIVLVDEAQDFWRQRSPRDPLPESVRALEKHRHRGFSFVLTCQHPKQLDFELRRYVDRHVHLRRAFNLASSVALEQPREWDPDDRVELRKCQRTSFTFPKHVYGWYESAVDHNMRARVPPRLFAVPVLVVGVVGLAWMGYRTITGLGAGALPGGSAAAPTASSVLAGGLPALPASSPASGPVGRDASAYAVLSAYKPRVGHLLHTAPRYDEVTKPVRAPYPAACVDSASRGCRCYTQQATPYPVSLATCRSYVARGYFLDFDPEPQREGAAARDGGAPAPLMGRAQGETGPMMVAIRGEAPLRQPGGGGTAPPYVDEGSVPAERAGRSSPAGR